MIPFDHGDRPSLFQQFAQMCQCSDGIRQMFEHKADEDVVEPLVIR